MEHVIEYSGAEQIKALEKSLDELNVFRYNNEYQKALGQVFIDKLSQWESDISRCGDSPFTIAVIGDFKRGKSTMINAFLGEEIVPVDVTTETVTLNRVSYGMPSNEAILSGGRSVRLLDKELKRENLEKLMHELGETVQRLELRRHCEILKKITIIDTPGTGDAMQDFNDIVKESLLQADAVIYVYNVQYPLSKSEQMFLKVAVLPQKYTSLFMAGNFSDTLGTQEAYDRMEHMLKQKVADLLPNTEPYMVSALDELCSRIGRECGQTELTPVLRKRFCDLRSSIDRLIETRRDYVVADRMQRLSMTMVQELGAMLDALDEGLSMSLSDVQDVLRNAEKIKENRVRSNAQLLKDIDQVIRNMKTETNAWMGEFIQRIIRESENLSGKSNDDLKRYYEFYCVELLQEALNGCVEYHEECLLDLMDSVVEGMSGNAVSEFGTKRKYHFQMNLDNNIWTKGDTVGLVTSYVASANLLTLVSSMIADGISGSMREQEKQNRVQELIRQISRKMLNMSAEISETVDQVYDDLGEKVKRLLSDYNEKQLIQAQKLSDQTVQVAAKSAQEKESMKTAVEKAKAVLEKVAASLRFTAV